MPVLQTNGVDLYYEIFGHGEPLVLVAGFSVDHIVWATLIPVFAKHYQVIVFDNRGVGQSSCPDAPYTAEMMADDAIGLVRALGLSSAHFIGHSFGGCIVQTIAHKYPDMVRSAVIACSIVKAHPRLAQYGQLRVDMMEAKVSDELVGRFLAIVGLSNAFLAQPGVVDMMVHAGPQPIGRTGLVNQLHALLTFDSRTWVGEIRCPALLIGAGEDLLADMADTHFMASAIKRSEIHCFDHVGHVPMAEQPDAFNQLVLKFLARHSALPNEHS